LWKRLPKDVKKGSKELAALWKIGTAMWKKEFGSAFSACEGNWSKLVRPFVGALKTTMQARNIKLISNAYSSISLENVASMLGLNKQQAAECSFFVLSSFRFFSHSLLSFSVLALQT
jgi:hypothetical protein